MSQKNGMKETQANNMADSPQMKVGRIQFSQKDYSDMSKAVDTALQYSDHDEMSMTDCEGKKVTIQYHWDTDIYDIMDVVRRLLIAGGYSAQTVEHGFEYMWNEFYVDEGDNQ